MAICLYWFGAIAQTTIGKVEVTTYTRPVYAAGTQNWAMAVDPNGRLYTANNEGLLIYNGTSWQLYPVPNKTILRSIAFGAGGKLYAGAQDELGYYAPDHAGRLVYTSLKNLLPAPDKTFGDIWDIEVAGEEVFFRATDKIFRLHNGRLTVYSSPASWIALSKYKGKPLAQDKQKGLLIFQNGRWETMITQRSLPPGFTITDILQQNMDTCLVGTVNNGLFLLIRDKLQPFVLKNNIPERHFTSLAALDNENFLAGTYSNGVYQINRAGYILENIAEKNGLQNNTVRCIYAGEGGNVWMGLDNGIAFMNVNDAIKHINPPSFNNGSGYGAKVLNGELYFALSTGLQWLPLSNEKDLSAVAGEPKTILGGLTWNVSVINNHLLAGRDDGFWKISNHQATQISSAPGYWTYQAVAAKSSGQIVAGNYTGIQLFEEKNGTYADAGSIKDFTESSRYVETDGSSIWVSHPYRGVFRIDLANRTVEKFSKANGLPANLDNHVFKIKNQVVFATPKGIYEYNAAEKKIIPSPKYAELFGQMALRYLKEDERGNIWFVQDKLIGVADFSKSRPAIQYIPELKNRILSGFENIYPYNGENVLIGSETGFYHINYEKYRQNTQPPGVYLTQVQIIGNGDSVLDGGYSLNGERKPELAIPYKSNSLHFSFATSALGRQPGTEFSCRLEGFDETWSNWSTQNKKDYTNLPEGDYTFHVKSRNSPSNESADFTYSFTVKPPWYRSMAAYIFYILAVLAFLYTVYKLQDRKIRRKQEERRLADQKKFEEEQRQLTYQHQLELEKTEKELIRLKNEKLEAEIEYKNAELASTAMNLVQKKEFMLKLTDELNKLSKGKETIETSELRKITRSLGSEEKLDEEWKQFSIHFNNVHSNFLVTLKNIHSDLNAHELKLCAYLRMNLSTKEMAKLMSISVKGVEINRYRLRKKLQLQPKEDLFQYLLNVDSNNKAAFQVKPEVP